MSPAVLSDTPSSRKPGDPRPSLRPAWLARASTRLDTLAAFLRSAHEHRVPF